MRNLLLLFLLSFGLPAAAQMPNTHGANTDAGKLDPATKARVRTEGSAGGIEGGQKAESQKEGDGSSGASGKATSQQGRRHDEASSDREEARGARRGAQKAE